jgi:[ribosomal protein S18]-alanine N-acetyltransferase
MAIDIYATHYIRWMIRRDVDEVLEIEKHSFCDPWTRDELICKVGHSNCIGMVIEIKDKTVGYMIYELHSKHLEILRLAVHEDHRFEKFGTKLIEKLKTKLTEDRRSCLEMIINEEQLEAQVFLRANGFICTRVIRNYYMHGESAYFFQFSI